MTEPLLDAIASDPLTMGWMQGFPPPPERQVLWRRGDHWQFPKTRWAFSHFREILPSVRVEGEGSSPLPRRIAADLGHLEFTPLDATALMTLDEALLATYTDGILILHEGAVVYERWFGVTGPETRHIAFSMTKSFAGTLAEILIAEGKLDPAAEVAAYVPELADSGFGNASVRQVLDMTTAVDFSEDYTDPHSGIGAYSSAVGFLPTAPDYTGPRDLWGFLRTVEADGAHGERFTYRTANTDVLNWILTRVGGMSFARALGERLWHPLGLGEADVLVDPLGTPFAGGGLCLRLEDLARFGEAIRKGGEGVIPDMAIRAIRQGGDPALFDAVRYPALPGWSYGSQWWHSHGSDGGFSARGIHGQTLWIAPESGLTIARFASHPVASGSGNDPISVPLWQALGRALNA
ncbi:6-aminohexanoate-dimer hydrolase [Novosphingobium nitrogenifigens DSM 19370]|uniref:6-aminohexanoate-dimer hydrolase n=1 Tax=Novosphingobium nitrogenifigens DSM 19370 TaxID=983920 RepID=F1ZA67_9SPHN|nr:serine hydrolase domain-containing protein [Novosphingobium nitrogenifigens]EGD58525.1 6-aminohexanoate-dimer hydrolase [Novosphingobium nitrogenifigens DSM 19370]